MLNTRLLIRQYIKEYISQHDRFSDNDLNEIGKCLTRRLSEVGFIVRKSNVSFNNVFCFDAEKLGKVYQIFIKKKFHSINEDIETFNRDELKKLYPDLFKNKNQSFKQNNKSATVNANITLNTDDNDDHTVLSPDNNLYKRNFEYTIEFQDKSKNNDIVIQHKKTFSGNKEQFKNFIEQFISELMKNFATK